MIEWTRVWCDCRAYLELLPADRKGQALACLDGLAEFARSGQIALLDSSLGQLRRLVVEWDHQWWVARRQQQPWPELSLSEPAFAVTRQNGRSRVCWSCPKCGWECAWDQEVAAWDTVVWPGAMDCPLCPAASSDVPTRGENPPSACAR